jgi:hypothetical protein
MKPEAQLSNVVIKGEDGALSCPVCHRMDKVEKVSEIVRSQTQEISGSMPVSSVYSDSDGRVHSTVSHESYGGTQKTNLAKSLQWPVNKPGLPSKHGCGTWIMLILIILATVVCGCQLFVMGSVSIVDPSMITYEPSSRTIFVSIFLAVAGLGVIGLCAFLFFLWRKNKFQKENSEYPDKLARANMEIERWDKAVRNWQQIFYCYRDGCVFTPGKNTYTSVDHMVEYCYDQE